ncbi:VWA domain-containing protein, partial [bacterium]|nr:VWA domain-containing protein [bacterium]
MSRLAKSVSFVFLAILLSISPNIIAIGQSASNWDIRVNLITTLETPDAMTLKVYFNVYEDRTGTPILNVDTTSAQVTLSSSSFVAEGQFKKPDIPIYIALVLDSSGSMGGAAQQLQEAAKLALNNTPNNSLFAVIQFDEEIKLIQDFTENIPAVS